VGLFPVFFLQGTDQIDHLIPGFTEPDLDLANEPVIFTLLVEQVRIGEISKHTFQLRFDLIPPVLDH
jgi:hypothetical protein